VARSIRSLLAGEQNTARSLILVPVDASENRVQTWVFYSLMLNTNRLDVAAALSDDDLLVRLEHLASGCRASTADLIAHLAELARRKNNRGEGEGAVFKHCTQVLKLSEAATFNRLAAANAARKFPLILDLAGVLTAENHQAILREATGKTKDEVSEIKARFEPKPDVRTSVRKLPSPHVVQPACGAPASVELQSSGAAPKSLFASPAHAGAPSAPPRGRPSSLLRPTATRSSSPSTRKLASGCDACRT
jgi:hypothetical protein